MNFIITSFACLSFRLILICVLFGYILFPTVCDAKSYASELQRIIPLVKFDVWNVTHENSNLTKLNNTNALTRTINVSAFENRNDIIIGVVTDRKPVKLSGSLLSKWKALSWDLWDLAMPLKWPLLSKILYRPRIQTVEFTTFVMLDDTHNLLNTRSFINPVELPVVMDEMFFVDFLDDLRNASSTYFYSTNYRVMESIAKLENDTNWRDFRVIERIASEKNISVNQIAPQLSFLFPGAALQTRYSEYHTMRVQLQGYGHYTLSPPHYLKDLYLYPSIHPAHHQSQVDMYYVDSEQFPRAGRVRAAAVECFLSPGDVLYIPPFWSVHSKAPTTLSVTLDVLSISHEQLVFMPAFMLPLPFNSNISAEERVVSAQIFLVHVLSRLKDLTSVRKFSSRLYSARYEALYPRRGIFVRQSQFTCQTANYNDIIDRMDRDKVQEAADSVVSSMESSDPMMAISAAVRWVLISDYVESVARWAVGDPELVPLFLLRCLDMDSKIEIVKEVEGPSVMRLNPEL